MKLIPLFLVLSLFCGLSLIAQDHSDLAVLSETAEGISPEREVEAYLHDDLTHHLDRRRAALSKLKTRSDVAEWQKSRRDYLTRQIGGLPEHGVISARVTGNLDGDGYRVENLLIEG
jgi:hypothetical protein